MQYAGLAQFLKDAGRLRGPIALILAEDTVELESTLRHHIGCGFASVLALVQDGMALPDLPGVRFILYDPQRADVLTEAVNQLIEAAAGQWIYAGFNAEYLFYPFRETRTVGEMLAFHTEERREAMFATVVDLYAGDLAAAPNAVSLSDAYLDGAGYYALTRRDETANWAPVERQVDVFGGLRWRFGEHVPWTRRRIDRIALFRARQGLRMAADFTLNEAEMNTYACPWHHNLTAAVCSFRTAKALRTNPGSRHAIRSFQWGQSMRFEWSSQQLMDLGFMEPGQWF
jgi:hypothetical protein